MQDHSSPGASLFRAVVDTAVDGVIVIDRQGSVQVFNPACERLFGYRAEEVVGQNVKVLMPTPFFEEHDQYLENYFRTGERKIIGIGREVEGRHKDGTTFPMHLSVGEGAQDGSSFFVGIIHDLTEQRRAQSVLEETASRLRAVVETAVDGVMLVDASGAVHLFNPACQRLFGYTPEEAEGLDVHRLIPSPFPGREGWGLGEGSGTDTAHLAVSGHEVAAYRKDGSTFPAELSVGEAHPGGRSVFVAIVRDLTERKRMEEQLVQAQKMEMVGQLAGGIAHDFNNLLTVIIGNADFLSDRMKARPDLREMCTSIILAGQRGAELTQRLLAFSRRQILRPSIINCNDLIEQMRVILRRTLREDIEIRIQLEPLLLLAFADPAQLESAVLNLALNAQDAMPSGGHLVIATSNAMLDEHYQNGHPEVPSGNYVMISVTDDGVGMAPQVLSRIFEPFFTTKEVGKGSGLGLSMVYGFIKQSSGHVAVYSEPGLGTTVRLYLPAADEPHPGQHEPAPDAEFSPPFRTDGTVLVVEDDPFVRGYAVATLESLGFQVITARDANEALAKLEDPRRIDVLFSDIIMPGGISGWELAERSKATRPKIKVLLTSGYSLESAGRAPAQFRGSLLNKPYRKADLARKLKEALESDD